MMLAMYYQPVPAPTLCRIRPRKRLRVPRILPPTDPGWHRGFMLVRPAGKRHIDVVTSSRKVLTADPIAVPQITPHAPHAGIPGAGPIVPVAPTTHLAPPVPGSGVFVSHPTHLSPGPSDLAPVEVDPLPASDAFTAPDQATLNKRAAWRARLRDFQVSLKRRKGQMKRIRAAMKKHKVLKRRYKLSGQKSLYLKFREKYLRSSRALDSHFKRAAAQRRAIRQLEAKLKLSATAVSGLSGFEALGDLGLIGDGHIDVGPIEAAALDSLPDELDPDLAGFFSKLKDFGKKILGGVIPAAASTFFPQQVQQIQSIQAQRLAQGNTRAAEKLLKVERQAIRKLNAQMEKLTQRMAIGQARDQERSSTVRRLLPIGLAAGAALIAGLALLRK